MKKIKKGFLLPAEIDAEFEALCEPVNNDEKWKVISAAILHFVAADEATRNRFMGLVYMASAPGNSFAEAVASAKATPGDAPASAGEPASLRIEGKKPPKHNKQAAREGYPHRMAAKRQTGDKRVEE